MAIKCISISLRHICSPKNKKLFNGSLNAVAVHEPFFENIIIYHYVYMSRWINHLFIFFQLCLTNLYLTIVTTKGCHWIRWSKTVTHIYLSSAMMCVYWVCSGIRSAGQMKDWSFQILYPTILSTSFFFKMPYHNCLDEIKLFNFSYLGNYLWYKHFFRKLRTD